MNEQELQLLFEELDLSKTGINWTIPGNENRKDVQLFIRKHFSESALLKKASEKEFELHKTIAIMEAKIFAYEQIISKSTFAAVIEPEFNPSLASVKGN